MTTREQAPRPHRKRKPRLAYCDFKLLPVDKALIEAGATIAFPSVASSLNTGTSLKVAHRLASVRSRVVRGMYRKAREVN